MIALELAQVVVSTVATLCMIGLGFLYRPSHATALWSLAFVLVMICTYAAMVGKANDIVTLRMVAMGTLLAAPSLIWSGLRAHRGIRSHAWLVVVIATASSAALSATAGTEHYIWAFRLSFAVTAVFAALTLGELVRLPERGGGAAMPLTAYSLVVAVVGIVSIVTGILAPGSSGASLDFLRTVNSLGMLGYMICTLITLLFLSRETGAPHSGSVFLEVAGDRLARAQAAGERSWALVYVQLDDADDLRIVSGDAGFDAIMDRLRADIVEVFPTEADIGAFPPNALAVLVAMPSSVLRDRVRTLLTSIAVTDDSVQVGTSASVGWAGVAEFGYDVDALVTAARSASIRAALSGGDRWERAVG